MSAFMQQLPALIGVVIGALGSYAAIVRGDRARFRREQTARWEERRLSVYADYARSLKRTVTLTYRVAAHLGNDPHPHALSHEEAAPLLAEAAEAGTRVYEALLLLGAPAVVEKARAWAVVVMEMERFGRSGPVLPRHGRLSCNASARHVRGTTRRSVRTWPCRPTVP